MKNILYTLISALALISCEEETGEITFNEKPQIILNALFNAENNTHIVQLRATGQENTRELPNSEISLYINGKLVDSATSDNQYYILNAHFEPGDNVEIVASNDYFDDNASATCVVPYPAEIVSTKTEKIEIDNSEYERCHIKIKKQNKKRCYYRVTLDETVTYIYYNNFRDQDGRPDYYTEDEWIQSVYQMTKEGSQNNFGHSQDIALMGGMLMDQNQDMSDYVDWFSSTDNKFRIFNSTYFNGEEYTLKLDVQKRYNFYNSLWALKFKIRSLTETEYNYLMGVNAAIEFESGYLMNNVPVVTSNIKCGTGIFAISTPATALIEKYDEFNMSREKFDEISKKLTDLYNERHNGY